MPDKKVRLYVGTRKGGYVAESDKSRRRWKVKGPFRPGSEVFHIAPDPRRPGDVYAAVNSGWWGPMLFRSQNYGGRWEEIPPPGMTVQSERKPPSPEGMSEPRPIANLWHIEPGAASEPDTVFLGIDPASLWRSDDRGSTWTAVPGLNEHPTRPKWNPGAGGMCLHTLLIDPENPRRMYAGISAAGTFRSDDGGETWTPRNRGVEVSFLPDKAPEFGQCVHKVALDAADPSVLYRQDHDGIFVSHDRADNWTRIGKSLAHDFGFVVASPKARPGTAFFVPVIAESRLTEDNHMQVYRWTDRTNKWQKMMSATWFAGDFGTHREGMATDDFDPAGVYVGTTTGQLFWSPNEGRNWSVLPYQFPGIHSVAVSSPPSTR